jgi:hypothetical protein
VWPAWIVKGLITVGFGLGDVIQAGGMLRGIRARAERGMRAAPVRGSDPAAWG